MREVERLQPIIDYAERRFVIPGGALFTFWRNRSLTTQFTCVAAVVIGITMAVLGRWVSARIEFSVITNTASSAALYMDRFVEPYVQDLATGDTLSAASQDALSKLIKTEGFKRHVVLVKIWRPDGTIIYSNNEELIGKRMPIEGGLAKALEGMVAPEFDSLADEENDVERRLHKPLLEIYSPIRETNTARIIGVAEFYQLADSLASELAWSRFEGFIIVGSLSLLMLTALIGIVRRGSQTIVSQQQALNARISELSRSLSQNQELRQRVADANRRSTESSERFLRRVSAELHDGPVQLVGLALLRLDGINAEPRGKREQCQQETIEVIRGALKDALSEIRGLSNGLALPELETLSLEDALDLAITNHERRSATVVSVSFPERLPAVSPSIKICAYRFVQEGLNNAFRHAEGAGQHVKVGWHGGKLQIEVIDEGPGFSGAAQPSCESGLGLAGMRDRIESLGGVMLIEAAEGQGTKLRATFCLSDK